jgi:hypothetical protein
VGIVFFVCLCLLLRLCLLFGWAWLWFAITVFFMQDITSLFDWLGLLLAIVAFGGIDSVDGFVCFVLLCLGYWGYMLKDKVWFNGIVRGGFEGLGITE